MGGSCIIQATATLPCSYIKPQHMYLLPASTAVKPKYQVKPGRELINGYQCCVRCR